MCRWSSPRREWQRDRRRASRSAPSCSSACCADIYGDGRLVAEGALPAAADRRQPRISCGRCAACKPPGGRYLQIYAADLGRGPDGRWWVLGDRTQAPSGAGYALENRLVLSRAFSDLYNAHERASGWRRFFRGVPRRRCAARAERDEPRICLLTPGPLSETYFEHAYLARYLGFLLVEGGDLDRARRHGLCAHHRRAEARSTCCCAGVDADFADPLELNAASQLGVPGLVEAMPRRRRRRSPTCRARASWKRGRCSASCRPCAGACSARS